MVCLDKDSGCGDRLSVRTSFWMSDILPVSSLRTLDTLKDVSFEDFLENCCDYDKHKSWYWIENDWIEDDWMIPNNNLDVLLWYDKLLYNFICKLIFDDLKNGILQWKYFIQSDESAKKCVFNFPLLDKNYIFSKNIKEILKQIFINPFNWDLIDIGWVNYDPFHQALKDILLANFIDFGKNWYEFCNPNFTRVNWLIDYFSIFVEDNYDLKKIGVCYDEKGMITDESKLFLHEIWAEFFEYFLENISSNIKRSLDSYFKLFDGLATDFFDGYVAVFTQLLYNDLGTENLLKIMHKFVSEKFDQSARIIPEDYSSDYLCEQLSMAFSANFDENISVFVEDGDYDFMKSKSESPEYLWFIKSISKWIRSSEISSELSELDWSLNIKARNWSVDRLETLCMRYNSNRISAWANYCSKKISELLFKHDSTVLEFDDFDSQCVECFGLNYHISKKTKWVIDEKFIKSEMDYVQSNVNKFVKDNKFFLENLKITDLFILYKFYRQIFEKKVPKFNEKYKEFKINYIKKLLEEKKLIDVKEPLDPKKIKKSENFEMQNFTNILDILRGVNTSTSSLNLSLGKKELPPELKEDLNFYFENIDPASSQYKNEIINEVLTIIKRWNSYRRRFFDEWPMLKGQFFKILWKYFIDDSSQPSYGKTSPIAPKGQKVGTISDWEVESKNLKPCELLWTINEQSSDNERINVYVDILKKLWYEFYTNPEDNNQNNSTKEDDFKKDFLEKSLSDPTLLNKFWSMLKRLVYWDGHLRKIVDKKFNWYPIFALNITWSLRLIFLIWNWKRFIYNIMNHDDYMTFICKTAR